MKEKAMHMNADYRPQTIAEMNDFVSFALAVAKIPEIRPEKPATDGGYIGKHEQTSVFDAMMQEIHADKELRREKYLRTHGVDKFGNPVKKDKTNKDRKRNKLRRISRMYGFCFEDGKDWYWVCGPMGKKQNTELDAEIVTNLKVAERDRSLRDDYEDELDEEYWEQIGYVPTRKVGYNTAERFMYNADKRMREIRAEIAEKYCGNVETYDDSYLVIYEDGNGYQYPYPDEYYNERATWTGYEYMIRKYGMEYANKYAKGEELVHQVRKMFA